MPPPLTSKLKVLPSPLSNDVIDSRIISASELLAWAYGHFSLIIICPFEGLADSRICEINRRAELFSQHGVKVTLLIIMPCNSESSKNIQLMQSDLARSLNQSVFFEIDRTVCNLFDLDMLGDTMLYRETFLLNPECDVVCQASNALPGLNELDEILMKYKMLKIHEGMLSCARRMIRKWLADDAITHTVKKRQSSESSSSNVSLAVIQSDS